MTLSIQLLIFTGARGPPSGFGKQICWGKTVTRGPGEWYPHGKWGHWPAVPPNIPSFLTLPERYLRLLPPLLALLLVCSIFRRDIHTASGLDHFSGIALFLSQHQCINTKTSYCRFLLQAYAAGNCLSSRYHPSNRWLQTGELGPATDTPSFSLV